MKICKWEEKVQAFFTSHLEWIVLIVLTILGCIIRYFPRQYVSDDAADCLLHWYSDFANYGGVHLLKQQVGNYAIAYQEFLSVIVYIPFNNALFEIKIFSCFFDLILALGAGALVYELSESKYRKWQGICCYGLVLCAPVVFINSSLWAQCDAIYSSFLIWCLYFLVKEKYIPAFLMYGLAFSFKLQALFLMPFLLWYWLYKKRFSILNFLIVPVTMIVVDLPAVFMGRNILEVFTVYLGQVDDSKRLFENYPYFWSLFLGSNLEGMYDYLKGSMIIFTFVMLILLLVFAYVYGKNMDRIQILLFAFLSFYTVCMFMACIHDRYMFFCEILIIVLAFLDWKLIVPAVTLQGLMIQIYGVTLEEMPTNFSVLAAINLAVYVGVLLYFAYQLKMKNETII